MAILLPMLVGAQVSVTISGTSPTCNGYTNGELSTNVSGGTAPYSYLWNNGANSNILQGLAAGNYAVTVTDANGDQANAAFNLTEPSAVSVSIAVGNPCIGGGSATATAAGGTGGHTYLWDTGATTPSVSGLSSGLHCVTVTDNSGCQGVTCAAISSTMSINILVQGLACFNFCDASVEAIVTGGTPPYSYNWSNGATGSVNPNLGPGTYDVTVTDANGCTISGSSTIGNPVQINVNLTVVNPSCGGGNPTGSASVAPTGGTAPYTVNWSTGAMGNSVSGLLPGNYSVTVTDFLGCTQSAAVVLIPQASIFLNVSATPSSACGTPTGTANATASGGVAPYTYAWSNGASGASISNLAPGNYTVVVTDSQGCGATAQVTVGGTPAIDLHITGVSSGCAANGSAAAMVMPGTGTAPYSFLWNTGATTSVINNLTAGTYSVTVTDANGCTAVDQVTVSGTSNLSVAATGSAVTCFNGANGSATATATGATGAVTYQWSNGSTNQTINSLSAGTYFVTVTDQSSGCTAFTSAFVSQPTQVTVVVTSVNGQCNILGSATAVATGGTSPYTYAWSNGSAGSTISNLNSGAYAVTATDANGCATMGMTSVNNSTAGLNVTVNITSPISAVGAQNGAVNTTVSGGTAPYSYSWSNGATTPALINLGPGTYAVTVTSTDGCTGTGTVTLEDPSCIGDKVWMDMNRNGCQDPGEFGQAGVTVTLTGTTNSGASVNMTTITALNGSYIFNFLQSGTYQVHFGLPTGFAFSPANACSDDFTDSDANASGNTGNIVLAAGHCNPTVDAGVYDACLNVIDPGTICCDQTLCGPGNDAAPINSVTPATGAGSPVQYMWMYTTLAGPYNPNTWYPVASGGTSAGYDPGLIYETTYFIRCTKAANCSDWKESNIVTVTVGEDAIAEISGLDLACVGDQVQYSAASNGPGATYSWNFGPWATPSTSTSQNPLVTWNQAGVVYITLSVTANGCTSTDQMGVAISNSPIICGSAIIIIVNNMQNAVNVEWETVQVPGNYEYAVQRSNDGTNFTNLSTLPQAQEPGMHKYAFTDYFPKKGNAYYRVEIRENGQHLKYSSNELVQRFDSKQQFMAHPNPVGDVLSIESKGEINTDITMEVLNLQGKLIESMTIDAATLNKSVSLGHLQSGTYLLRLQYNNGVREVIKFVKG
ncbi:MAG: T9SS type A sorting domain-containing protein [Saprospiraceae bacterium]|nr:T9SS type A sorting domain-containing protein [Saprospiraceae bacterium]MCF8249181.1 T9SS type A sorting domain-containing protein [Saprospiraceae bacterium]MCF8281825.1 T9SS type A sorting domain-containing protein [Bacteroidales bacterium]MCF8311310.1 T9SS type A sorting domain-containing protein [Saprospiraceae bacterium]MCF8440126.1 T9SS type A sorting domain-containing protein [Saprospiraceae bacterium]